MLSEEISQKDQCVILIYMCCQNKQAYTASRFWLPAVQERTEWEDFLGGDKNSLKLVAMDNMTLWLY